MMTTNIMFFNGLDWYTPSSPLLKGTKRAYYLQKQLIKESDIIVNDLNKFSKVRLINSMLDLEEGNDIFEIIGGG
jgi:4-amino-4-deoxychorismate lyase